jgi:hypothetical protein
MEGFTMAVFMNRNIVTAAYNEAVPKYVKELQLLNIKKHINQEKGKQ